MNYEDWTNLAITSWLLPCLATLAALDAVTTAMSSVAARPESHPAPFDIPCADEELFA